MNPLPAALAALCLTATPLFATGEPEPIPLRNWIVAPTGGGSAVHALADLGTPGVFVAITPCRMADTRVGSGHGGSYGAPAIAANTTRTMNVLSNPTCTGIASGAFAVSFNFTATNAQGPGDIRVFPAGTAPPLVSTLNYVGGQTIANAAVVPLGSLGGGITIQADVSGTDLIVDVNGYFVRSTLNPGEFLTLYSSTAGGAVLVAQNLSTSTSPFTAAIRGTIAGSQDGPSAILGEATATSGVNYGVRGENGSLSANSAAILGISDARVSTPATSTFGHAAVRGESYSGNGVIGVSGLTFGGQQAGAAGYIVDSSGTIAAGGRLGFLSYGVYAEGNTGATGTKSFVEPHPDDPTKVIRYVCLEGPESGTYFRGRGRFVGGAARVDVPESFRMVSDSQGLTVQITPIGGPASPWVESMDLERIEVRSNRDVEFSYLINGVRRAFKDFEPVVEGLEFRPRGAGDRMPAFLAPDVRRRLVENGTYNADGTVNLETAERLGWAREWRQREEAARPSR